MVAIRYNKRNSFAFPSSQGEIIFYPGLNLAVDDRILEELKAHPVTKILLEQNVLEPLISEPTPHLEVEGIPVVDGVDEPLPAMPVNDRSAAKAKPTREKITRAEVMGLGGDRLPRKATGCRLSQEPKKPPSDWAATCIKTMRS